ncbi:BTAD domain-containing putative transcriptional regulator [Spirillospora sp. NPDC049024]
MHDDRNDDAGLRLLPSFRCVLGGREVSLSQALCRLLVTVALEPGGLARESLHGRLWPDTPPAEAGKRLRQALWRVRRDTGARILAVTSAHVALVSAVDVDLHRAEGLARQVAGGGSPAVGSADVRLLGSELLPSWPDEDVRSARDRWDRLRLLALERLAEQALANGDVAAAIELAELAARADRLAEAPHRITAAAHLMRGDHVAAWRVYTRYQGLLVEELGIEPSPGFRSLVERRAFV